MPCVFNFIIVSMNWSIDTVPFLNASPSAEALTKPMASATCFICAGIAVIAERHSNISGLPLAYDCDNCSSADFCISELAPPARIALFSARNISVDLDILLFTAVNLCTAPDASSRVVGSPISLLLSFCTDAFA